MTPLHQNQLTQPPCSLKGDFFALELLEGHLYLHLSLGSGSRKVKATNRRIDDGWWHEVTLNRDGQVGRITVDEGANDFTTPGRQECVTGLHFGEDV